MHSNIHLLGKHEELKQAPRCKPSVKLMTFAFGQLLPPVEPEKVLYDVALIQRKLVGLIFPAQVSTSHEMSLFLAAG